MLAAEVEPEQPECHDLRGECLGRSDPDLGARMQVDAAIGFARDRAADDVHDPDDPRPRGACGAHRLEGVRRFTRLRDGDRERSGGRELPAIAVLGGILHAHWDLRQRLDDVPSDEPGMPGRAACHNRDVANGGAVGSGQVQAVEPGESFVEHEPAAQRAAHRVGLFGDLLLHEMGVAVELDRVEVPGHVVHLAQLDVRLAVDDMVAVGRQHGDVAVVEMHHRTRVLQDRRSIGRDEVLVLADAEQHRRPLASHHDLAGFVGRNDGDAVRPHDVLERADDARLERVPRGILDQVDECLGVGLGPERVTRALQRRAQRVGILDDPVVNEGDGLAAVNVRMRVARRGRAVRRPARVGDARDAMQRPAIEQRLESRDAARELADDETAIALEGDARGVIAAVLEALQPGEENRPGPPLAPAIAGVANDAAHGQSFHSRIARVRAGVEVAGGPESVGTDRSPNCASCDSFSPSSCAMSSAPSKTPQCRHRNPLMRSATQCSGRGASTGRDGLGAGVLQRRQRMPARDSNSGPPVAPRRADAESRTSSALTPRCARVASPRWQAGKHGSSRLCGLGASVLQRLRDCANV